MTALHYACTRAATAENVSVAIRALLDAGAGKVWGLIGAGIL